MNLIPVPKLSVQVVTGDTCYANEGGFSAIYAEVITEDSSLIEVLSRVQKDAEVVTLRCAMLDVTGRITKFTSHKGIKTFVLIIDDLTYRKPRSAAVASN
jgi:hypothetical protein